MQDLVGRQPAAAVVSHDALLIAHDAAERIKPSLDDRVFQRFDERADAFGQLFRRRDADHAALHTPPVIDGGGAAVRALILPMPEQQVAEELFIERAPVPEGRGKRLRRAVAFDADQPVGRLRRFRRKPFVIADHVHAVPDQRRERIGLRA